MNRKAAAILAALLILTLTACKQEAEPLPPPAPPAVVEPTVPVAPEKPAPPTKPPVIFDDDAALVEEILTTDSVEEVVDYEIKTPQISVKNAEAAQIINDYYASIANKVVDLAWGEVYEQALEYHTVGHLVMDYQVRYNDDGILSITRSVDQNYQAASENQAGIFGPLALAAETFDLRTGGLVTLDDLFIVPETQYMPRLVAGMRETILINIAGGREYEPQWETLLTTGHEKGDFYLTDDALWLFYQEGVLDRSETTLLGLPLDALEDILKDD